MWGWDPFGGSVFMFSRAPAAFFDVSVIGSARQGEVVDVGAPAAGPVIDVMDLAPAGRHITARARTPALDGIQHQPLGRGGQPAVAAPIQLAPFGLVEH